MPIPAHRFDRLPDPNQPETEAIAYRVLRFLRDNQAEAFRADEIAARLLGRKTKGVDLGVAMAIVDVENALELLVKQGHVQMKSADGPFGVEYYRAK